MNTLGQRTNVILSGTAIGSARDIAWGYDDIGQVISADSTIPGLDCGYRYDAIGNVSEYLDSTGTPEVGEPLPLYDAEDENFGGKIKFGGQFR